MNQVVLRSTIMEIRVVEISQLKRAEYNPRKELTPADPEYQQLKKSIKPCIKQNKWYLG